MFYHHTEAYRSVMGHSAGPYWSTALVPPHGGLPVYNGPQHRSVMVHSTGPFWSTAPVPPHLSLLVRTGPQHQSHHTEAYRSTAPVSPHGYINSAPVTHPTHHRPTRLSNPTPQIVTPQLSSVTPHPITRWTTTSPCCRHHSPPPLNCHFTFTPHHLSHQPIYRVRTKFRYTLLSSIMF